MAGFKKRSDYSTLIGIAVAVALVVAEIASGGNSLKFVNLSSVAIVIGGTLAVTIACFSFEEIVDFGRSFKNLVLLRMVDPKVAAAQVLDLAEHSKRQGILALQQKEDEIDPDSLLGKGVKMLVDGVKIEEIEVVIKNDIESSFERNGHSAAVARRASELAPAMGLVGTLIGLVQMLGSLSDPSQIGEPMALALLTTLYGAVFAFMILTPLASKIERNSDEELLVNKMYLMAISVMGKQENPRKLQTLVNSVLPPTKRINIFREI